MEANNLSMPLAHEREPPFALPEAVAREREEGSRREMTAIGEGERS